MYKTIYVPVDNSDYSNAAVDIAIGLGKAFSASLVGCHVYAAKLHDVRFKQMEFTLPDEYKEETELEKQRRIHDALIARGLQLISDSYLDLLDARAHQENLSFERKHFDGKNFEAIVKDVNASAYDLVVLGALGQGAVKDSQVGSVVERLLRRTEGDTLVVRELVSGAAPRGGAVAVGLDGSAHSYGGLVSACRLAAHFDRPIEILAAVDVQGEDAALMRAHLAVAERYAQAQGVSTSSILLEGSAREAIAARVQQQPPWLLVLGRCGIDANGSAPIGSTVEHLVRRAPCNVLVVGRPATPTALA